MAKCCADHFPAATGINTFLRNIGCAVSPVINSFFCLLYILSLILLLDIFIQQTVTLSSVEVTSKSGFKNSFIYSTIVACVSLLFALFLSDQLFVFNKLYNKLRAVKKPFFPEVEMKEIDMKREKTENITEVVEIHEEQASSEASPNTTEQI